MTKPAGLGWKILISLLTGTALLVGFAWFVKFKPSDIATLEAGALRILNHVFEQKSSSVTRATASVITGIAVAGIVSTAYVIPLRLTRVLVNVMDLGARFTLMTALYFLLAGTTFLMINISNGTFSGAFADIFGYLHQGHRVKFALMLLITGGLTGISCLSHPRQRSRYGHDALDELQRQRYLWRDPLHPL